MKKNKDLKFVKLVTVFDQFKISLIKEVLKDNDIPFVYNTPDNNTYNLILFGTVPTGLDIYVPDFLLEKSQDIIYNLFGDEYDNDDLDE